jgi:4-alpha-glucanotransferase
MVTDGWGITEAYDDWRGERHETQPETRRAILAAMGVDASAPAPAGDPPVIVIEAENSSPALPPGDLILEDGTVLRVDETFRPELPFGYHELHPHGGGQPIRVIASPGACHLPEALRVWGWAVQLYAARSRESWGIGDLADLRRLGRWSGGELGARIVLINPINAVVPVPPLQPSPYFPSSRRFRNPIYLRVEEAPGAREHAREIESLAAAGRALDGERRIDRDAVYQLKLEALARLWARLGGDPAFDRYCAEQGAPLEEFATFCALAVHHGGGWRGWPPDHRHPRSPAVARFREAWRGRVRFHQWLQWLLDDQLRAAAAEVPVMQDLPIGVDADGADAWSWQDVLATDVSVGAPPDNFAALGQDWGLPPFVPHKLRAARYEPFIQTIRATLRHAGALRIDHVMGLFRLFWIPKGLSPAEGAFVRYPVDDLLAIVALESHRAQAFVVGEDLGTVEGGVRERLARHRILSYRLYWFEPEPTRYPELALAAVTTHDLPTVAGLWSWEDVKMQEALGRQPNVEGFRQIRERLQRMTGAADSAPVEDVIERTYRLLGEAPSMVVTATLDDAAAVEERPNLPGTTTEWPNWSIALPMPLEELEQRPLPRAIARALARP